MFKKLKDKIAEEVKSSPSRIQELAKVAQVIIVWALNVHDCDDKEKNRKFAMNDKPNARAHTHTHVGCASAVAFSCTNDSLTKKKKTNSFWKNDEQSENQWQCGAYATQIHWIYEKRRVKILQQSNGNCYEIIHK